HTQRPDRRVFRHGAPVRPVRGPPRSRPVLGTLRARDGAGGPGPGGGAPGRGRAGLSPGAPAVRRLVGAVALVVTLSGVGRGGLGVLLDVRDDPMRLGGRSVRIERAYRVFKDNELYIGAARLGALFDSRIVVDWAELSVTFMEAEKLPLGMRVRRETAREAFL